MAEQCAFCDGPVNPHDVGVFHEIRAWVSGPKSDGAVLRENTGRHAHYACVEKAKKGVAPDQPELF